jgi:phage gp37-like protein
MTTAIERVEDFIVDKSRELLGQHIGTVDALPSGLTPDMLKKFIGSHKTPGIYPVFMGGKNGVGRNINAQFDVYVIVKNVNGSNNRRRGDSTMPGAYFLATQLLAKLHDNTVQGVGTLKQKGIKNLFSMTIESSLNAALYAVSFEVPNLPVNVEVDSSALADFLTFYSETHLTEGQAEPSAEDLVNLEQEEQ